VFGRIARGEVGATARVAEVLREVTDGLPLRQISIDLGFYRSTGGALIRSAVARAVLERRASARGGPVEAKVSQGLKQKPCRVSDHSCSFIEPPRPEFERPFGSLMMSLPAAPE
jgi:hypothetical protein